MTKSFEFGYLSLSVSVFFCASFTVLMSWVVRFGERWRLTVGPRMLDGTK